MFKKIIASVICTGIIFSAAFATAPAAKPGYFEIKVYRLASNEQVQKVERFLKDAYLPALHKAGIKDVGVYHLVGNDTAVDKRVYVFIPLRSIEQVSTLEDLLTTDATLVAAADSYWNTAYNATAYSRMESIVLKAFPMMTGYKAPNLSGPKTERVYELRSYEGPTEKLYRKKVEMFNAGGEVTLFERLGFNAVFYAEVIAGSRMPNLMYMTSFNNRAEREAHWTSFKNDAEWKTLSGKEEYKNTVSKSDIILLNPADFSEL